MLLKKSKLKIIAPLILLVISSSCASILNPIYQKVEIQNTQGAKVLIDGEEPKMKKGKYLLRRDGNSKQITLQKEGFKDVNAAVSQYKMSPWHTMSWIPFGITLFVPLYDVALKAYDYDKEIEIEQKLVKIPERLDNSKRVKLLDAGLSLGKDDLKFVKMNDYNRYNEKGSYGYAASINDAEINFENTIFSKLMNDVLKSKDYIDTSKRVLKNSYLENIYLSATISNIKINRIYSLLNSVNYTSSFYSTELEIKWEVKDYYKSVLYSNTIKTTSGEFTYNMFSSSQDAIDASLKDAMEYSLIELFEDDSVKYHFNDKSQKEIEEAFEPMVMKKGNKKINSLATAINSAVTVKNGEKHGSGFAVSKDGHIVTNYHVVVNSDSIFITFSDNRDLKAEILRVSKIHDLALLKVDTTNISPFVINESNDFVLATDIYAVGTPTAEDLAQTITKGIISAIRNLDDDRTLIQTDASVNGGNSGGALLNKNAEVIGVVSSKIKGFSIEGLSFGIPSETLMQVMKLNIK